MTTLREAAQQALGAMRCAVPTGKITLYEWDKAVSDLKAALAEPVQEPQPLTEEEIEKAYREIWRDLPSDFDHTSSGWIELGIKYAEQVHGIT